MARESVLSRADPLAHTLRIMSDETRKIIHLDMDCFYAAVEMRERPDLANRPLAVGGGSRRGVVTTCNYAARAFGVRSAMPGFQARELCPDIVFVPVRFDLYRRDSAIIRRILLEYTPLVEPLSLDEAYMDVTSLGRYAWDIAKEIRSRILEQTQLTSSAGIAPNKMLAKIASEWRKPDGQFAITPDAIAAFMLPLPVRKLWGVGPKSAERLEALGIRTCGDLQRLDIPELIARFGRWGHELYSLSRGIDHRPVVTDRPRKSLSNESTFPDNLTSLHACALELEKLIADLRGELAAKEPSRSIHKAFVKVKFADFTKTTCETLATSPEPSTFLQLLDRAHARSQKNVRLLGVGVRFHDAPGDEQAELKLDAE